MTMDQAPFRRDFIRLRKANRETRPPERLAAHYQVEKRLADQLRMSAASERHRLYGQVYQELFASLPDHPQHVANTQTRTRRLAQQSAFLLNRLDAQSVYVEVGCGDAALTKQIAARVRLAIGVDVTNALIAAPSPDNFTFLQTDGTSFDLPEGTADLVYSNQLMEHLHPEDAQVQLTDILRILKPNGCYICTTPSRVTGPHDISRYFGYEPCGFHLQEYDHGLLNRTFRQVGFRAVQPIVFLKGAALRVPMAAMTMVESVAMRLPRGIRAAIVGNRIMTNLAGVTVVGVK